MRLKIITVGLLSGVIFISGCSFTSKRTEPNFEQTQTMLSPAQLIATDFVNALSQLPDTQASQTTIDLLRTNHTDRFTHAMSEALQRAGYGTRWVDDTGSLKLFQYRLVEEPSAASTSRNTFELAVGVVEMRRSYVTDSSQRVRPVSALYVRGADASGVVLSDELFESASHMADISGQDGTYSNPAGKQPVAHFNAVPQKSVVSSSPLPIHQRKPNPVQTQRLQNPSVFNVPVDANPLDPIISRSNPRRTINLPLIGLQKEENVFELGGSNFDDVLSGHVVVIEKILTFANDSMQLGRVNKTIVQQLVERFNPQTDVFSVIGCSMGSTRVRGGNAALALGRAGRVVEALRFAGVSDKRILDEGCWAGDGALEKLPRRGVVLTLNRQV